ncbi:MAG: PfkB family carbohydrate kinase, partial [Planctomycetales bacterium]
MSKPFDIVGLGEVLWDVFPDGAKFGGAPANFACSSAGAGGELARSFMASAVGDDVLGRDAEAALRERRVDTSCLQVSTHVTGSVTIEIDDRR